MAHPTFAPITCTDSGGGGEAVVLIHGGGLADWFTPLAAEPALRDHRVIRLVRAGYTGAPAPRGLTVAGHSEQAAALLDHLGTGPAHVVAHSSGCTVALQLALDHPDAVRGLTLCEPPLVAPLAAPADRELLRTAFGPVIGTVMAAVARGDLPAAFDTFMTLVCGPGHRAVMTQALGAGRVADAVERSGYFFTEEMPAVDAWTVEPAALATLRPPVLLVQGGASPDPVHRLIAHLAEMIPGATVATVPGANHLLPLTDPGALGDLITRFSRATVRWC
ncbi:hypothetical protein GCM10010168_20420 [Actinoplanes ianthinogenes]|uniref:AB hydrolase-1 domain-containing protein n=1 Tax=Actinoplanes ianthinogenes TaxID=122358 RepID=A0ABN6CR23_9ACTN|nr:alpha/beta hydrolase [Actinoplanes ianthinogenes]BCJ47683.1 hypothetical protein Aiant_83400 [Actinoplanes ianthinogenes]GGR03444.1 hypothetical protein GCM10010168_20420 [Actinoplanes ianthinogenes]